MDEEKSKKDQKEMLGDGSISRRKFFKKMAYAAPVVLTFIASEAHAVRPTPCQPASCRPAPCRPAQPPPCAPNKSCNPNPKSFRR
jgi:hypothetical protein